MVSAEPSAPSLLSNHLQRLDTAGVSITPMNRVFLAGSVAEGFKPEAVIAAHEAAFSGLDVTGLMLILPTGWVGIVEATLKPLSALLKKLDEEECVANVKMVGHNEDVPARYFTFWSAKVRAAPLCPAPLLREPMRGLVLLTTPHRSRSTCSGATSSTWATARTRPNWRSR